MREELAALGRLFFQNQCTVRAITWLSPAMCHLAKCLSEKLCSHPPGQVNGLVTHPSNIPDWCRGTRLDKKV